MCVWLQMTKHGLENMFGLILIFGDCGFAREAMCPTLCDSLNSSLPGSSVHEILQARILEWVAIPFARGSSRPRDQTRVSSVCCVAGGVFTIWATGEAGAKLRLLDLHSSDPFPQQQRGRMRGFPTTRGTSFITPHLRDSAPAAAAPFSGLGCRPWVPSLSI